MVVAPLRSLRACVITETSLTKIRACSHSAFFYLRQPPLVSRRLDSTALDTPRAVVYFVLKGDSSIASLPDWNAPLSRTSAFLEAYNLTKLKWVRRRLFGHAGREDAPSASSVTARCPTADERPTSHHAAAAVSTATTLTEAMAV